MASDTAPPASTFDWDVASAVTYAQVNRSIAEERAYPTIFAHEVDGSRIEGTFSDWRLATGGSEGKLAMVLDVQDASETYEGTQRTAASPFMLEINVQADFIPVPGTQTKELRVSSAHPVVMVTNAGDLLEPFAGERAFLTAGRFLEVMLNWLQTNLEQFSHVFATVDFAKIINEADPDKFDWLKPSLSDYAVSEPRSNPTNENSVFGVLCLVGGWTDQSGLEQKIAAGAIPVGETAACLISPRKFLTQFMLPASALYFSDLQIADAASAFEVEPSGTTLRSTRDLTLEPLRLGEQDVSFTVPAGSFSITLSGGEVKIAMDMTYHWSLGINLQMTYSAEMSVGLDPETGHLMLDLIEHTLSAPIADTEAWLRHVELGFGVTALVVSFLGAAGGAATAFLSEGEAVAQGAATAGGFADAAAQVFQAINAGQRAATLADRLALFGKIVGMTALAGAALSSPYWVAEIVRRVAEGQSTDIDGLDALAQAAVGDYIAWPTSLGRYEHADAALNGSLVLTLRDVS